MLGKLNFDLINYIIEYLPNHEIMEFIYINKKIYDMFDKKKLLEYMEFRDHPMVFNILDNYCKICNLGILFLNDDIHSEIIRCPHVQV